MEFDENIAPPTDSDDDEIAPPDDNFLDDYDMVPDPPSATEEDGLRGGGDQRMDSVFSAATSGGFSHLDELEDDAALAGHLTKRKSRGNIHWARKPNNMDGVDAGTKDGKGLRPGGADGDAPAGDGSMNVIHIDKDLHYVQQALKYHLVMRPRPTAPLPSEEAHLMALIQSYFIHHGFHRSATALRNAETGSAGLSEAQTLLAESLPTHRLDLPKLTSESARKTQTLFDDDRAWRSHTLFDEEIPLITIDERNHAEGGSLDLLIEKLILEQKDLPFTDGKPDLNFTNVFLIMSSSFACPDVLFSRLTKMFKTVTAHHQLFGESRTVHLQRRTLQVLVSWTQLIAVDMTKVLAERIAAFAISTVHTGGHHFEVIKVASNLLNVVQKRRSGKQSESWIPFPQLSVAQPVGDAPAPVLRPDVIVKLFSDIPEKEVARQLSLVTFELFQKVRPREFFNCAWMDPILRTVCQDLSNFMHFFEDTALWVASIIVAPVELSERRASYQRCIRIARMFYDMQNFFMAQAFLNGIDHSCVTRMGDTVAVSALPQEDSDSLDALRTALNPFQNVQKNMPYKLNTACLPDIAPYLSEMCHAAENAKTIYPPTDVDDPELINWSKMLQVGKVIIRLVSFQSIPFKFQPLPIVQRLLKQMPGKRDADTLFRLSKEREGTRR